MSDRALQLYHRLPASMRTVVAMLAGLRLRWWRYGPETERLVEEAHEREHWSAENWRQWQEARLAYVLERAATRVPYYREDWRTRRRNGDRVSWELLENWPILEKEALRMNPRAFTADDCDVRRLFHEHTSGTSGTPLDLWWSRATVRAWYALFEARIRRWHGVTRFDRWAMFGGQLVTPVAQRRPPFWVWNAPLNQLYVSSYHLAPKLIPACLAALRRYRLREARRGLARDPQSPNSFGAESYRCMGRRAGASRCNSQHRVSTNEPGTWACVAPTLRDPV